MKEYSVTTTSKLRQLCIDNNWFTCGSIEQYDKLFEANYENVAITEIATIIWLCSNNTHTKKEILQILLNEKYGN